MLLISPVSGFNVVVVSLEDALSFCSSGINVKSQFELISFCSNISEEQQKEKKTIFYEF